MERGLCLAEIRSVVGGARINIEREIIDPASHRPIVAERQPLAIFKTVARARKSMGAQKLPARTISRQTRRAVSSVAWRICMLQMDRTSPLRWPAPTPRESGARLTSDGRRPRVARQLSLWPSLSAVN